MHSRSRFLATLLALFAPALASAADGPAWLPEKTYAFVASVVTWKEPSLGTFTRPRLDNDLVATLKVAGVPAANIQMLKDQQATLKAVRAGLTSMAQKAGEGSTLIFYFQGHGLRRHGKTTLAVYDIDLSDAERTGLTVDEVGDILEKHWKGERVLLFGDCCHSGALGEVAARLAKRAGVKAAALTSSLVSNRSTGHWTYTEALIAAFSGEPILDRDGDGSITFAEVERFVRDEMKYAEGQLSFAQRSGGFEPDFVLRSGVKRASAASAGGWKVGDYLRAKDHQGKWYGARVIDVAQTKDKWKVHFPGWDAKWDEWLGAERIQPIAPPPLQVGRRYEVEWNQGRWFVATVIKELEGFFWFVHYAGEEGEDDEWVTQDRVRPVSGKAPEFVALDARQTVKVGDSVAARWKTRWYLATVTARTPEGVWRVHYADGMDGAVVDDELFPVLTREGELSAGDRVLGCWKGKPEMYGGTVVGKDRGGAQVKWDDGSPVSAVVFAQIARVRDAR